MSYCSRFNRVLSLAFAREDILEFEHGLETQGDWISQHVVVQEVASPNSDPVFVVTFVFLIRFDPILAR